VTNSDPTDSPGARLRREIGEERPMAAAVAESVYLTIRRTGSQPGGLSTMQTREHLYEILNCHEFESGLDSFFKHQI
jgi:2-methylisocitrate lyase-like PEP mutase family enzyme